MKKFLTLFSLVLACAALWTACSDDDDANAPGTIYGIATVDGDPLKGIGVALYTHAYEFKNAPDLSDVKSYESLMLKTVTYEDGHYEFTDLNPREYYVVVESEGVRRLSCFRKGRAQPAGEG